jgi:hypothetical protein
MGTKADTQYSTTLGAIEALFPRPERWPQNDASRIFFIKNSIPSVAYISALLEKNGQKIPPETIEQVRNALVKFMINPVNAQQLFSRKSTQTLFETAAQRIVSGKTTTNSSNKNKRAFVKKEPDATGKTNRLIAAVEPLLAGHYVSSIEGPLLKEMYDAIAGHGATEIQKEFKQWISRQAALQKQILDRLINRKKELETLKEDLKFRTNDTKCDKKLSAKKDWHES